jgi:hypothetical protein
MSDRCSKRVTGRRGFVTSNGPAGTQIVGAAPGRRLHRAKGALPPTQLMSFSEKAHEFELEGCNLPSFHSVGALAAVRLVIRP